MEIKEYKDILFCVQRLLGAAAVAQGVGVLGVAEGVQEMEMGVPEEVAFGPPTCQHSIQIR
jgi:hypothetical protein